jgi:hypothetical protein
MRIINHGECGMRWDIQGLDYQNADRHTRVALAGIQERLACFMRRMLWIPRLCFVSLQVERETQSFGLRVAVTIPLVSPKSSRPDTWKL